jgi:hypothetical protein
MLGKHLPNFDYLRIIFTLMVKLWGKACLCNYQQFNMYITQTAVLKL